jgi:non-homologous end joining protein Ku
VKRKAAGKTIEAPERDERPSNVVDLMEALRQSVSGRRQPCRRFEVIFVKQEKRQTEAA